MVDKGFGAGGRGRYFDTTNLPHDHYGGGSVTVWAGVTANERINLVPGQSYWCVLPR